MSVWHSWTYSSAVSNSGKQRLWDFFLKIKAFVLLGSILLLNLNITELLTTCELGVHYIGLLTTFWQIFLLKWIQRRMWMIEEKKLLVFTICPDLWYHFDFSKWIRRVFFAFCYIFVTCEIERERKRERKKKGKKKN